MMKKVSGSTVMSVLVEGARSVFDFIESRSDIMALCIGLAWPR